MQYWFRPVVQDGVPSYLKWIEQKYFCAETLSEANANLVDSHSQLHLANMWSGREIASADGLRFITPVKSGLFGLNPKYFSSGCGVRIITIRAINLQDSTVW